jgi:hypothetical protein
MTDHDPYPSAMLGVLKLMVVTLSGLIGVMFYLTATYDPAKYVSRTDPEEARCRAAGGEPVKILGRPQWVCAVPVGKEGRHD